jgi:hypothetical protein
VLKLLGFLILDALIFLPEHMARNLIYWRSILKCGINWNNTKQDSISSWILQIGGNIEQIHPMCLRSISFFFFSASSSSPNTKQFTLPLKSAYSSLLTIHVLKSNYCLRLIYHCLNGTIPGHRQYEDYIILLQTS